MEYNDINANEIEELLSSKQYLKLVSLFRDMNAADIAQILDGLENEDSLKLFRLIHAFSRSAFLAESGMGSLVLQRSSKRRSHVLKFPSPVKSDVFAPAWESKTLMTA